MKKLFILFLAMGLLTACNNNPFAPKDNNAKSRDKDEKDTKDDMKGRNDRDDDDDDSKDGGDYTDRDDNTRSNWTNKQRNMWLKECIDELENNPNAKQICSCVLEKAEKKYPDASDAENATEAEGERWGRECISGTSRDDGFDDNDYSKPDKEEDNYNQRNNGNPWSDLQRQQYIQGCATTARQAQGFTAQQANSYCDCMTRKVERKYSFKEAAKLTAADFQTQEWTDAAMECRSR